MPIYEYACMECESHFEELVRNAEQAVACPDCGAVDGLVNTAGAHQKLTCGDCGRYIRFVGKAELGLVPRTVATTRAGITPGVRARILERATGKCEVCGATDRPIHVGHCLSVREATEQGLTDEEIVEGEEAD